MTTYPIVREGMWTPWDIADSVQNVLPGIGWVSTPSHGGVKLSPTMNRLVPDYMRCKGGWYEEDCEWAIVYVALAELLQATKNDETDRLLSRAASTLRNWFPDEYEKFFGKTILEGESIAKDHRIFKDRHKNDMVAISAIYSKVHEDFIEVTATIGGVRDFSDAKTFLVPSADYDDRKAGFNFVVDPAKYEMV